MLFNAKEKRVSVGGSAIDYVVFGSGKRKLVMLPGLTDGIRTVRGLSVPMALLYRKYGKHFTVYAFSRKNRLKDGASTLDMAEDQIRAMDRIGLEKASVMGISLGGMIAQHMAADHPERVEKLVLAVTAARPNPTIESNLNHWIELAIRGAYREIMVDTTETFYTPHTLRTRKPLYPVLGRFRKPRSLTRFETQAKAFRYHDAYDKLHRIKSRTLVIGGGNDKVVGGHAARELAERIPRHRLIVYKELGHAAYEEAKNFNTLVLDFLR